MEQFALIGMKDTIQRYIKEHSFLRILPIKWARGLIPKTKPKLTHNIYSQESQKELGYIMDVPGFFLEQQKMDESNRIKVINNIIEILAKNNIRILVFPLWRQFINLEERNHLEENSIILLDGNLIRLVLSMVTIEKILGIPKIKAHTIEVGIWGADTDIGQIWAEFLAPFLNYMTIGGEDIVALENLSNKILLKTGLSCSITKEQEQCLHNKTLSIVGEDLKEIDNLLNSKMIVYWGPLCNKDEGIRNENMESIFMESGWVSLPDAFKTVNVISPWDHIGVLEAIIFIIDEFYRDIIVNRRINLEKTEKVKEMLMNYNIINSSGLISNNELISYNGFRRLYFTNKLDKSNIGNYN